MNTTTLKYVATNECATINNSSLTHHRIVNYNRSPKACWTMLVQFKIEATHKQIDRFRRRLQKYVKNRPRHWDALLFFRNLNLNKLDGCVTYILKVRHTQGWENPVVFAQKAELELQIDKIGTQLGIMHVVLPATMKVELVNGDTISAQARSK